MYVPWYIDLLYTKEEMPSLYLQPSSVYSYWKLMALLTPPRLQTYNIACMCATSDSFVAEREEECV